MNVQLLLQEVTADSGVIAGEGAFPFNPPIPMIMSPLLPFLLRHGTFYPLLTVERLLSSRFYDSALTLFFRSS